MSTKAIEKVLRDMQCDYTPCLPGTCRKHEAQAEMEAIKLAATAVGGSDLRIEYLGKATTRRAAVRAGVEFLRDLAKESP